MSFLLSTVGRGALLSGFVATAFASGSAFAVDITTPTTTAITLGTGTNSLNVSDEGSITTSGSRTITWSATSGSSDTSITVDNAGTIENTNASGRAFSTNGSGASWSLNFTNEATGIVKSADDALRINVALGGGTVSVNNYGLIYSTAEGQAIDFDAATGGTIVINNYAGGIIQADGDKDVIRPGANATIVNAGTISSVNDGTFAGGEFDRGDAIDFQGNGSGTVINQTGGLISGAKHGITGDTGADPFIITNEEGATIIGRNGSGINFDIPDDATPEEIAALSTAIITNYGTITGDAQDLTNPDYWDTDGDGVDIDYLATINNYGTIQALGALGNKDLNPDDPNISDGISIGGGMINNYAGATIYSVGRGIQVDDSEGGSAYSATTIYNEGTIESAAGLAINLVGDWNDVLTNKGVIIGDVLMGGGNDQAILYAGQSIDGTLDGGVGSDTLTLTSAGDGAASIGDVANFEILDVAAGQWSLADDQSYSSGATVRSGASLTVDTILDAATTVEGGARLQGYGTLSGLVTTGNRAIISPGRDGAVGTLTVNGNVELSNATLVFDLNQDGTSDLIDASGSASIAGGTVLLNASAGAYTIGSKTTIVSADAGASSAGTTSVESSFLFINPVVGADANAITLTMTRNDVAFASLASTVNQTAVANAIDASAATNDLYRWTVGATDASVVASSFDTLSGEVHADVAGTLTQQSMQTELMIMSRLSSLSAIRKQDGSTPALGYADDDKKGSTPAFDALAPAPNGYAGWTQAYGSWLSSDGNGNAAGVDSSVGGALVGADYTRDNYTVGLAGGYSWGSVDVADRNASADIETGLLAIYGAANFDAMKLRGGASIGWSSIDTTRVATVAGMMETPHASYDATTTNLFAELAYTANMNGARFEPFAALGWSSVDTDGFTETNAPLTSLSSDGVSYDTPYSTLGLRFSTDVMVEGMKLTPRAMVGWRHAFDDVSPEAAMVFNNTNTGFTVEGAPIAQDSLLLEAGADIELNRNASLGLSYVGSLGDDTTSNSVKAIGEIKF